MEASLRTTVIPPPKGPPRGIPLPSARFAPILIAALLFFPLATGEAEDTQLTATDDCNIGLTAMRTPIDCALTATATIEIGDCHAQNCTLIANSTAQGMTGVPGYLAAETRIAADTGTSASVCLGPDAVNDELDLPCGRLCTSHDIGTNTLCTGSLSTAINLPRGTCTFVYASSSFGYNGKMGSASVGLFWQACRATNDRINIIAFG